MAEKADRQIQALARQIRDDETARLIQGLVSKLEKRLNAKLN